VTRDITCKMKRARFTRGSCGRNSCNPRAHQVPLKYNFLMVTFP